MVCKRLQRTGRLFVFLREHRHELFDEPFQAELATMYSERTRGTPPKPPALLAMVTLLQAYTGLSDAAAVEQSVFDRRWQMVLGCEGVDKPPYSQGTLVDFRRRLIEHDMDRRLVERTVELAKTTGGFGHKALRVSLDSAPLWGAGRVEDTFNLIGHALDMVVQCAAAIQKVRVEAIHAAANLELLGNSSLKAALDIDWDDPDQQQAALHRLLDEVERLKSWLVKALPEEEHTPALAEALALLARVIEQDIEPDPDGNGARIRRGVSRNRRISASDGDMRHGRKSRSRVINGFKRHLLIDLDSRLILGATVRPANEPEHAATAELQQDAAMYGPVEELAIDRGYLASDWVASLHEQGVPVISKPWRTRNGGRHTKDDFKIDLTNRRVTCPAGAVAEIRPSGVARFRAGTCDACAQRSRCTRAKPGRGRSVSMHPREELLVQLRQAKKTSAGRRKLRERTRVEHALAHVCRRQGRRARYRGVRKNVFDLRRIAAVENLHVAQRLQRAA
jgi:hypothetical protein